jgi:serine/threonine-protein kinase
VSTKLSHSATLLGTPHYMPPEAILGRDPVDVRADIYALGAVAYFLLTGTLVFSGSTIVEVCAKHLSVQPDSLSERLGRALPPELEALVLRCLEKDRDKRPATAQALDALLAALPVGPWSAEDARRWWHEQGQDVEARVRARREARAVEPSAATVEVDPLGRDQPGNWSSPGASPT